MRGSDSLPLHRTERQHRMTKQSLVNHGFVVSSNRAPLDEFFYDGLNWTRQLAAARFYSDIDNYDLKKMLQDNSDCRAVPVTLTKTIERDTNG